MEQMLNGILNEVTNLGWTVSFADGTIYELRKTSPKGLDLLVFMETEDDPYLCVDNLQATHSDFDPEEEAAHYLNQGNLSASMIQAEMEYLHQEIWKLWNSVHQFVYA